MQEEKIKNVINFYVICNKLKDVIRTGWKNWHVEKERIESVAEHVYGVQMLAIAIYSEFNYDIDIEKVILMLAIHELEETMIGDLTQFEISREEKAKLGHEAVEKILSPLEKGEDIKTIIMEFDERKTKEASFAYHIDKLECDIQCKLYDEAHFVDVKDVRNKLNFHDPDVEKMLDEGATWSQMWMTFGEKRYGYDKIFMEISKYVKDNQISN